MKIKNCGLKNTEGFTLIEVILFLAVSGALAVIAIVALTAPLRNIRFTSAVRELQGSFKQQMYASQTGSNTNTTGYNCSADANNSLQITPNPSGSGGKNGSCIIIGRLAIIQRPRGPDFFGTTIDHGVIYRDIIAPRTPLIDPVSSMPCGTAEKRTNMNGIRYCYQATPLSSDRQNPVILDLQSGLKQSDNNDTQEGEAFGFYRSPENNTIHRFHIVSHSIYGEWAKYDQDFTSTVYNKADGTSDINADPTAKFPICFEMGPRTVKFIFSNTAAEPELKYDEAC